MVALDLDFTINEASKTIKGLIENHNFTQVN